MFTLPKPAGSLGIGILFVATLSVAAREPQRSVKTLRQRETVVYPVAGTAGFETGIVRLATLGGALRSSTVLDADGSLRRSALVPEVDWGDGSVTPALLANCTGPRNLGGCDVFGTHVYDQPDEYTVTIRFTLRAGGEQTATTTATITPPGAFVILSIGDSVASGEGNPITPATLSDHALWDDLGSNPPYNVGGSCHRSSLAGPAVAARMFQETDAGATFVHLACSGATLGQITDQLWRARERLPRIDILLISGGANNVAGGFGNVVKTCLDPRPRQNCSDDPAFEKELSTSIAGLADEYDALALAIDCLEQDDQGKLVPDDRCTGPDHVPPLVLITEYFDPTRDRNGEFPGHLASTSCVGHAVAPREWEFLYDNMVVPLNAQVASAATRNGWILVDGLADAFREHGYCASAGPGANLGDTWIVKGPESLTTQGDPNGTGHPNPTGHEVYGQMIFDAMMSFTAP